MCKILVIPKIKNNDAAKKFISAIYPLMSLYNTDGLGYTAIKTDGTIFTERWLHNNQAFKRRGKHEKRAKEVYKEIANSLTKAMSFDKQYSMQGKPDWENLNGIMLHTRMATSAKGFANTHPFVNNENTTSIIHNGMIRNDHQFTKLHSTCDSEIFLTQYDDYEIGKNPDAIKDFVPELAGYWATAVTTLDEEGKRVIDIFKNSSSSLHVVWIDEIGGYVFSTSARDLEDAADKCGFDLLAEPMEVKGDHFMRFNMDGKIIKQIDVPTYVPKTYTHSACAYGDDDSAYEGHWHNKSNKHAATVDRANARAANSESSDSKYSAEATVKAELEKLKYIEDQLTAAEKEQLADMTDDIKLLFLQCYQLDIKESKAAE